VEISKGNLRDVPNVVGQTEDVAKAMLANAGFRVSVVRGAEVDAAIAGKVTSQTPDRGQDEKAGSTVEIVVSQPRKDPTTAPSVTPTPTPPGPLGGIGGGVGIG
jgi:serine/threonine-protein kinase